MVITECIRARHRALEEAKSDASCLDRLSDWINRNLSYFISHYLLCQKQGQSFDYDGQVEINEWTGPDIREAQWTLTSLV